VVTLSSNAFLRREIPVSLQELRLDKVGDLIWSSGGEDLYPIGQGDLLLGDHGDHFDLAGERIGACVETTVDLDLGKRSVLVPFNKDEIVASKQAFDQLLDRLLGVGIPEQDAGAI